MFCAICNGSAPCAKAKPVFNTMAAEAVDAPAHRYGATYGAAIATAISGNALAGSLAIASTVLPTACAVSATKSPTTCAASAIASPTAPTASPTASNASDITSTTTAITHPSFHLAIQELLEFVCCLLIFVQCNPYLGFLVLVLRGQYT